MTERARSERRTQNRVVALFTQPSKAGARVRAWSAVPNNRRVTPPARRWRNP